VHAKNCEAARSSDGYKAGEGQKQNSLHTGGCNTCHRVDQGRAGVDNEPTSSGAFGKRGDRNSPTTFNAGFHLAQFWDGRAANLKEQAKGPVLNPVEMAMPTEVGQAARPATTARSSGG